MPNQVKAVPLLFYFLSPTMKHVRISSQLANSGGFFGFVGTSGALMSLRLQAHGL